MIGACVRLLQDPKTPLDVQGSTLEVLAKLASEKTETQFAVEQQALTTVLAMLTTAGSTDVQCQVLASPVVDAVARSTTTTPPRAVVAPARRVGI